MTVAKQATMKIFTTAQSTIAQPKMRWTQILAISIFWFALNFHWTALGITILPSQVLKLVGNAHKGQALAFVLIPGAFISLFANPLFGWISDQTHGRLARWGRRRPYILIGTLLNVGGLLWMALATNLSSLVVAYLLVQFASNMAQAPFHALLPDIVAEEQRGMVSGVMGLLSISGNVAGAIVAGLLISSSKPLADYYHGLWMTYGIIIAVLLLFMLITILSVHEHRPVPAEITQTHTELTPVPAAYKRNLRSLRLNSSSLTTIAATISAMLLVWGLLFLWNTFQIAHLQINSDAQQVVLEIIVTLGILRIFDFNPRRDPDFAWVLITRFLMMMGVTTIQNFVQYYMHDVVGVADPELETTKFLVIAALTSLVSALLAGWLSDRIGRKKIIYIAGSLMALLGLIVIITHLLTHSVAIILPVILISGALFGMGYGAYQSVDWALVADVLPSQNNYAKDMGIWNISLSLPQVIAPAIAGPLIDTFTARGLPTLGFQLLFAMSVAYCLISTLAVRYIRGVKA